MESKRGTINDAGTSVTLVDATMTDVLTTALSSKDALYGTYGLVQRGLLFGGGMLLGSYLKGGDVKFWSKA